MITSLLHDNGDLYALRRVFFLAAVILLLAALFSPVVAARDVTVALPELKPSVFTDEQGKPAGLFVDLIEDIAAREGWKIIWVHSTLSENWDKLASGEIDLVMGVVSTPEREKLYDFNHEPALSAWSQVYAPHGSGINTILDLDGKRIALLKGDINGIAFRDYARKFNINATYLEKDSLDEVFAGTAAGTADAAVVFSMAGEQSANRYDLSTTPVMFNPSSIGFAVQKGKNQDLLVTIDRYLAEGKADPSSTYSKSMEKWFGMKASWVIPPYVWWSLATAIGLVALFVIISFIFRQQVRKKTAELIRNNEELHAAYEQLTAAEEELRENFEELTRSEQALRLARKKLNLLNYVTFNDIENMIFTLSGYNHLAKDKVTESSLRLIIEKEEDILKIITRSLKFSQTYQDLGLRPPRWQNVSQVFLLAISHLDFLRMKHTVTLNGLEIFSDPLLEQVFQILADNTLTHGKTATEVTLRYTEGSESITLLFEDNGMGISEDIKDKIFLPDFQKNKTVGLFLVREILEITRITITETGEPGKGARFEITVPKGQYRFTSQ